MRAIVLTFLGVAFAYFATISVVLNYHWNKYSMAKVEHIGRVRAVYFIVSGLFLLAIAIFAILSL